MPLIDYGAFGEISKPTTPSIPGESGTPDKVIRITISNRPLPDVSDECYAALLSSNQPPFLFLQQGRLVRLKRDEHSQLKIEEVTTDILRNHLARSASFLKTISTRNGLISVVAHPPIEIVRDLLARSEWDVPPLIGIINCPTFRPDGSVIIEPGYDAATGLFYDPSVDLAGITLEQNPSREQALVALQVFQEPFVDFPFEDNCSRSNAMGLAISYFIRPVINGCVPIALIDATKQGTGKGLLVDVIEMIARGKFANKSTCPVGDEEIRKKITSLLLTGSPSIIFDNVTTELSSGVLASAVTTGLWQDRLLGKNQTLNLPQKAIWIVTGNNIQLRGDLPRRGYRIRLDAKDPQPWLRTQFKHPKLLRFVEENRRQLVEAALTMVRFWFVSNRPIGKNPIIGSFEEWSEIVGGILSNVGIDGFLANSLDLYHDMDVETLEWDCFLTKLHRYFGRKAVPVREIMNAINKDPELRNSLPGFLEEDGQGQLSQSFKTRLGKAFADRNGTRFGNNGVRVEKGPDDTHSKTSTWRFVCGGCGVCGG